MNYYGTMLVLDKMHRCDVLRHHGRLGMKWYKHIFGDYQNHARYAAGAAKILKGDPSSIANGAGKIIRASVDRRKASKERANDEMIKPFTKKEIRTIAADIRRGVTKANGPGPKRITNRYINADGSLTGRGKTRYARNQELLGDDIRRYGAKYRAYGEKTPDPKKVAISFCREQALVNGFSPKQSAERAKWVAVRNYGDVASLLKYHTDKGETGDRINKDATVDIRRSLNNAKYYSRLSDEIIKQFGDVDGRSDTVSYSKYAEPTLKTLDDVYKHIE